MIAGSLARFEEPADDALESQFTNGRYPALYVERTQESFDDRPIQSGKAADTVETIQRKVEIGTVAESDKKTLHVERVEDRETLITEWVADPTGTGLIAAESTDGEGPLAFPFDQFYNQGGPVERLEVDIPGLFLAWRDDDALGDVWMNGSDPGDGASINYHAKASADRQPTIGLGFERPWNGTVMRGVAFQSGYAAIYSTSSETEFIRFVGDELLPFAYVPDDEDEGEQATLDDTADDGEDAGDGGDDWVPGECDQCGHDRKKTQYLDGRRICIICADEEGMLDA
ncbi:hypothetical protein SAMN05216388_1017131 [Halorientalis persicus]|uniref:Uncharacterized protein n=1 Tax=Halorientalis persicus TaxID=1367881 RepID=A0A1H8S3D3_9EURY|nr:hypothetical protein [Halorientalis persicus]SEO73057.1 hypothetical protein SAMN05216388_1017131 [Halorientalis persicus]